MYVWTPSLCLGTLVPRQKVRCLMQGYGIVTKLQLKQLSLG